MITKKQLQTAGAGKNLLIAASYSVQFHDAGTIPQKVVYVWIYYPTPGTVEELYLMTPDLTVHKIASGFTRIPELFKHIVYRGHKVRQVFNLDMDKRWLAVAPDNLLRT